MGNFEGGQGASHCKVQGHTAVICAETAEPIDMLFGLWAEMGPRNHVLEGVQIGRGNFEGKGRPLQSI